MKEVFQRNKERTQWLADVVSHPFFKESCVFAIAQHSRFLGDKPGDEARMKGGVEILRILGELPLQEEVTKETRKLNYAV